MVLFGENRDYTDWVERILDAYNDERCDWIRQRGEAAYEKTPFCVVEKDPYTKQVQGVLTGYGKYNWIFISLLAVRPDCRKQGIGSQIIKEAISYAKAHDYIGLYVNTWDFQARDFYLKQGFRQTGMKKDCPPGTETYYFELRLK